MAAGVGAAAAAAVLGIVEEELRLRIIPGLRDEGARHSAGMAMSLVGHLATMLAEGEALAEPGGAGFGTPSSPARPPELLSDFLLSGEALAGTRENWQRAIEAGESDLPPSTRLNVVQAESRLQEQEQASNLARVEQLRARLEASETAITPALATRFVATLLGAGHRVDTVASASGGYSKDTQFFSALTPGGKPLPLVIRRDLPFGPGETRIVQEYRLLQHLFAAGFPVAEPLALDESDILGQPAMISARVDGKPGTEAWAADPVTKTSVCHALAQVLARLHRTDPASVGLARPGLDPREAVRDYVLEWQARWHRYRVHPSPVLAQSYAWLLDNIPSRIDRLAIVHGDVGFHNTMVADGDLVALLDWEFAHVGDAAEDLSYFRPRVEEIGGWDDFITAYVAAGGCEYAEENARFFDVWRAVRNATCTATAWRGFLSGAYPALKMAYQGITLYRRFVRDLAGTMSQELSLLSSSGKASEKR